MTDVCERIEELWKNHEGRGSDGQYRTTIGSSDIVIKDLRAGRDDTGRTWLDVWTGNSVKPTFRIVNPPMFIPDPSGDIVVEEIGPNERTRMVRVREDPIQAVVEAVAGVRKR